MFSKRIKNKRGHHEYGVFVELLRTVSVILFLAFLASPAIGSPSDDWLRLDREAGFFFQFVDGSEKVKLDETSKMLDDRVKEKELNAEVASGYFNAKVFYFASCIGTDVDKDFCKGAGKLFCGEEDAKRLLRSFCQGFVSTGSIRQRLNLYKHYRTDSFCLFAHEMSPGAVESFIVGLMPEFDSASLKKMRAVGDSLCRELRNGDVSYSNALYSYLDAAKELKPGRLAGEVAGAVVKTTGSALWSLVKVLGALLGIIGSIIGIFVGLKKLLTSG